MTQRARVLAAARRFNGVCQTDFLLPDVCDGGTPITRVGARLFELDAEGYVFEHLGWREKCKVFRLVSEPEVEGSADERRAAELRGSGPAPAVETQAGVSAPLSPTLFGSPRVKPERPHWQEDTAA